MLAHPSDPSPPGEPPPRRGRIAIGMLAALVVMATGCTSSTATSSTAASSGGRSTSTLASGHQQPHIRHVFVIMMENEDYTSTFANPAADPYLATTLPSQGVLLQNYYGIGHFSNDNYVGFVSGQAPNPSNQTDCLTFEDFPAGTTVASNGQVPGSGCVFPASVPTVATQLNSAGFTWKGYMEDMGNVPTREAPTCGHPPVGSPDQTEKAVTGDGYAAKHNPFVYFHSIIDNLKLCNSAVVPLGTTAGTLTPGTPPGTTGFAHDLMSISTTPNFSFISPNLCNDGHDATCVNQQGQSTQLANVDAFLQQWVPLITSSAAFKKDGLLEVTFDEADSGDSTSCCNEIPGPATAQPGVHGPGGGHIGTVLISQFIRPGTVSQVPYNHYSSLATIENLFGLDKLGQANTVSASFGADVFDGS